MNIRPVSLEDIPQIEGIWAPVIRDTLATFNSVVKDQDSVKNIIKEKRKLDHAFLVVESERNVVGFGHYGQFRDGVGYAHAMEHTIILDPRAQGKGVGRFLMSALEEHAASRGAHCMLAGVSSGHPDAFAFHAALGYSEVARVPQVGYKFDQRLDLILMQKFLKQPSN
ncbi:MAG: N-acetyltransferase family protein [Pseudoruegeria sp.]